MNLRLLFAWMPTLVLTTAGSHAATVVLPLEVTSTLPAGTIPMDVEIDFASLMSGIPGDLQVVLNGRVLQRVSSRDGCLEFGLEPKSVKLGIKSHYDSPRRRRR